MTLINSKDWAVDVMYLAKICRPVLLPQDTIWRQKQVTTWSHFPHLFSQLVVIEPSRRCMPDCRFVGSYIGGPTHFRWAAAAVPHIPCCAMSSSGVDRQKASWHTESRRSLLMMLHDSKFNNLVVMLVSCSCALLGSTCQYTLEGAYSLDSGNQTIVNPHSPQQNESSCPAAASKSSLPCLRSCALTYFQFQLQAQT